MTTALTGETTPSGMKSLFDGLRALGPAKLASMGLVSIGMLCMLALLMLRGGGGGDDARMALLYGDLDLREAGQMADLLDKAHIKHELSGQSDQIMVPESQVASARLLLAKSNLPSGGSVGYEIFDRGDSLTSTQFQQEINQTRALEGELVRSITLIQGVRGARVHLVLPHRDLFAVEAQPAQASVLLTMHGSAQLDPEAIQAILNLVSAAVPGLKPQAIAIIDNHGNVLARNGSAAGYGNGAATSDELRQSMELRLSRQVEDMLDASLGPNKVRAEASVTLDDAQVNETQENYNPDQQVLRSQQTSSDKSRNTQAQQNTSVANNLPNADAGRPQTGSQDDRREETSNYEIGKTVRTLTQSAPRVQRVSLAVLVDGVVVAGHDGKPVWQPRSASDLARIAELVKSAIGFDAKRGDVVTVDSMRFDDADQVSDQPPARTPFGLGIAEPDLLRLLQTGFIGLITLIIGLFVFRPIIAQLSRATALDAPQLSLSGAGAIGKTSNPSLEANGRLLLTGPNASAEQASARRPSTQMLTQLEIGQARNSSTRRLGELVEQFPEESLTLVRAWLSEGVN